MISIVSLPLSIVADFSQYLYQDWEFAKWIAVAIVVDTVLSVWKHLIHKDASSEQFFSKFSVHGSVVGATQWIGTYLCVFMMVREVFSCVENIQAIYPILPASFVRRLKDFNDKGEYINQNK